MALFRRRLGNVWNPGVARDIGRLFTASPIVSDNMYPIIRVVRPGNGGVGLALPSQPSFPTIDGEEKKS